MSYVVTRPQWRALKTIAGPRRTVAATAKHVPHQTRSFLLRKRWIEYATGDRPPLFYRLTGEGRRMLALANKHYAPPKHRVQAAAEIKARKLKAAPNLGSGLVDKVDAAFEKLVNTPIAKVEPRRGVLTAADLARGIPHRFGADRGYIISTPPVFDADLKCFVESSPDQVKNAAGRAGGCSRGDEPPVVPGATTCGRPSETPGFLPCRRPPHTEGPCAHEPNAQTALEIIRKDPTGPEARAIAADLFADPLAKAARAYGAAKYPHGWVSRARETVGERRERVLKVIDAQRVPDLVAVLKANIGLVEPEELARMLLHAARRPPTIAELMERARANAGIGGGPDTIDQLERETQQAGARPTPEHRLPATTALERVALEYAAHVLERPEVYEHTVGAMRFPGEAQDGYLAAIEALKNGAKP